MTTETDNEPEYQSVECFRCDVGMPVPEQGQPLAAGWALDVDGDVVYCPEHVPGPPYGWRDKVTLLSREQISGSVDPALVPEQFRHLFQ